ncbi:MAG TPA: hypothetical protein VLT33_28880, partial [Labilithrix sp.]|nr:hypothetical protein [Labilithrix sp.]
MKVRLLLAGLATCSASLVASTAAQAMVAPPSCIPAALVPSSKQPIPVNLPGFGYTALGAKATDIHLFKVGSPGELGLTVGPVEDGLLKVVPAPALAPGGSYRIEFASFCGYGATPEPGPFTFTTAPEAPLPTKLGDATSPLVVAVQDHGTSAFTVSGAFALDPAMQPWASIYKLSVVVDGTVVATKVTLSPAYDSATVTATGWCDAALASTTKHTLLLRARLPFAPPLDSAPLA